ncbi:FadR/GntR family transcriptional regulator [Bacillus xiapuensis]|uniref:FadR/GntR family transcriptional regulator n=1 Tax=Bacillus xiapuensis TaxID=2014075 RepID=UPI000C2344B6|nr:FadR/GntR family transcriptional regulator [Bacillus xiapuensis]
MNYKKIKPKKIYEEVADALLDSIRSGNLRPGDKLDSVQQLAENFQVGRSAIREALTSLRAMGLIELRQGEGTYVKGFSPSGIAYPIENALLMNTNDKLHLLEVRKILEVGVAFIAAQKRTEEDVASIRKALEEMKLHSGDIELGEEADFAFHLSIAKATGNPLLSSLMNHVSDLLVETMKETRRICLYSEWTTVDKLNQEHEAICQAIAEQNPEKARLEMSVHLHNVETILVDFLNENENAGK